MDVLSAVIERPPPPFSAQNLSVPESFERIVFKALQKERESKSIKQQVNYSRI